MTDDHVTSRDGMDQIERELVAAKVALREIAKTLDHFDQHNQARECRDRADALEECYGQYLRERYIRSETQREGNR